MNATRVTRLGAFAVAGALLAASTGCAGARTSVVADEAAYPISLSRAVRDQDGSIVASEHLTKVGSLHQDTKAWGMFYSAVKLTPRTDISRVVNAQVAALGGDAVVNLRVSGNHCVSNFFVVLTLLPFFPGCARVEVDGDIVKVSR
jgi:hypothetical protein